VAVVLKGFREFILRGNVVDLAVAVVIGAAFGAVVTAFVNGFLTPLVGILGVNGQFQSAAFSIRSSQFEYGAFINAVISFVLVAAAVYFFVVVPMLKIQERRAGPPEDVDTRDCPECLSTIPKAARRCSFCTSEVGAVE
jgi:large conductance mechanosensitive channel